LDSLKAEVSLPVSAGNWTANACVNCRSRILSGFSAGAWLGAAEAPTKLVNLGISPVIVSLLMVSGVFLAR